MQEILFSGGDGTKASPYLISKPSDFMDIFVHKGFYYKQTCDIDMAGIEHNHKWDVFTGHYDGNNYNIYNAECKKGVGSYGGALIETVDEGSSLRRVNLRNTVDCYMVQKLYGLMEDCSLVGTQRLAGLNVGLVYWIRYTGVLRRSYVEGVKVRYGGIAYSVAEDGFVEDCYCRNITLIEENRYAGGFIGMIYGSVKNSYVDNFYLGHDIFDNGGFANRIRGHVSGCFVSNFTSKKMKEKDFQAGGFVGDLENGGAVDNCYAVDGVLNRGINSGDIAGRIYDASLYNSYGNNIVFDQITSEENYLGLYGYLRGDSHVDEVFSMNSLWNTSETINKGRPYLRRFWEGTHLSIEENPWAVDPSINDGMPYLKKLIDGNVFVKTAGGWIKPKEIYIKTIDGWKKTDESIKVKTQTGWK